MFSIFRTTDLAALTKTTAVNSGDVNEFVSQLSQINIYAVASAIGVRLNALADSDVAIEDKEIPFIGTTLDKSAHLIDSFTVGPGTRVIYTLRETANVATTDILSGYEVIPL